MQEHIGCDAVEELHHAWREAAFGAPDKVKRPIGEVLELLDNAVEQRSPSTATVQAVRGCIESARAAVKQSDSLGVVLALVAALQELEHEPANGRV